MGWFFPSAICAGSRLGPSRIVVGQPGGVVGAAHWPPGRRAEPQAVRSPKVRQKPLIGWGKRIVEGGAVIVDRGRCPQASQSVGGWKNVTNPQIENFQVDGSLCGLIFFA